MVHSHRSKEGYLLIDHRASPGVKGGVGEGTIFESATSTCSHCHRVVVLNPNRTRERGFCTGCNHYICDGCNWLRHQQGGLCSSLNAIFDRLQEQEFRRLNISEV